MPGMLSLNSESFLILLASLSLFTPLSNSISTVISKSFSGRLLQRLTRTFSAPPPSKVGIANKIFFKTNLPKQSLSESDVQNIAFITKSVPCDHHLVIEVQKIDENVQEQNYLFILLTKEGVEYPWVEVQ